MTETTETDDIEVEYLEPETVEEDTTPKTTKSGLGLIPVLMISAVAALLGAIGGAFGAQYLIPKTDYAPVQSQIDRAIADVKDENRKEIAALKSTLETLRLQTADSLDQSSFEAQLSVIEERVLALENTPAPSLPDVSPETLKALQKAQAEGFVWPDTSDLELDVTDLKADIALLKLDIEALEAQPFALSPNITEQVVQSGLLPSEPLEFPLKALLAAAQSEPTEQGFLARALNKHIKVKDADGPVALIEKAADEYAKGDLRSAIITFDKLPDDIQKAGQDWRDAVKTPK